MISQLIDPIQMPASECAYHHQASIEEHLAEPPHQVRIERLGKDDDDQGISFMNNIGGGPARPLISYEPQVGHLPMSCYTSRSRYDHCSIDEYDHEEAHGRSEIHRVRVQALLHIAPEPYDDDSMTGQFKC